MTKSFLTATALVALLGFGATGALAQQTAPKLDTPVIQKSAPIDSGKVDSGKAASGVVKDKSKATTPNNVGTAKPAASTTKSSAASCTGIKDKTAHDACMKSRAKSSKAPAANQKATAPKDTKPMVAPAPRG